MAAAFAMLAMPATRALATTYDADTTAPANDGNGNWNTSTLNWYNGSSDVVWSNGIADTATFGAVSSGTGGTVVVGTVNAGLIQFNPQTTTGYTLSTGTITLGTGITTTSAAANTISAKITGSAGLAFNGVLNATNGVTLSGANDYTGITTTLHWRSSDDQPTPPGSVPRAGATTSASWVAITRRSTPTPPLM